MLKMIFDCTEVEAFFLYTDITAKTSILRWCIPVSGVPIIKDVVDLITRKKSLITQESDELAGMQSYTKATNTDK